MEGSFSRLFLCIGVLSISSAAFLLGTVALILPNWANFRNRIRSERGWFGPWTICRDMEFGRTSCGSYVANFKPIFAVYAGGILSAIGVTALAVIAIASTLQIIQQCHRNNILFSYFTLSAIKLIHAVVAALLLLVGLGLFAAQGDDLERGYIIEWAICFYLEVILTVFAVLLLIFCIIEFMLVRRLPPGFTPYIPRRKDSTPVRSGLLGTTISNPGYRDNARQSTNGISMTDSSVRFVLSGSSIPNPAQTRLQLARSLSQKSKHKKRSMSSRPASVPESQFSNFSLNNGSVNSNGSTVSSLSTISTIASLSSNPRGPLRSSLKKSKTSDDGFGIHNPGFSGTSPTLSRTGSLKKVRIQTQSTDV